MAIIFATYQNLMAETIKDRLKQLAQLKGLSIRAFEETCGLGRGNISNMNQGGSIGSDKLSKILDTFPSIDMHWLLTGRGEMLSSEPSATPHTAQAPAHDALVSKLLDTIKEQAEEIGRLKAQIDELERRRGVDASAAASSKSALVG